MSAFSKSSYEACNAAVHLQNTLCTAMALARLSVRAKPGALASPGLVTCEASFTSSTAEGALQTTVSKQGKPLSQETQTLI